MLVHIRNKVQTGIYLHHVIEEYLSIFMTCVFAIENYKQETSVEANRKLREHFNTCMNAYEKIYKGRENWPLSTEDLVDYRTIAHFHYLAEQQVGFFLEALKELIPSSGTEQFDIYNVWNRFRRDQEMQ